MYYLCQVFNVDVTTDKLLMLLEILLNKDKGFADIHCLVMRVMVKKSIWPQFLYPGFRLGPLQ